METYSMHPFVMRQKTVFRYDEYLVRVTDLSVRTGGKAKKKTRSLADLGKGFGLVEDASGYLL